MRQKEEVFKRLKELNEKQKKDRAFVMNDPISNSIRIGNLEDKMKSMNDMKEYLKEQNDLGNKELRISILDDGTGIIHPLGKDGSTYDFDLNS